MKEIWREKKDINNLWDNKKWFYIYAVRFPEKEILREKQQGRRRVFKEITF